MFVREFDHGHETVLPAEEIDVVSMHSGRGLVLACDRVQVTAQSTRGLMGMQAVLQCLGGSPFECLRIKTGALLSALSGMM